MKRNWVVEYSVKQNCFHVTTLEDALKINWETAIKKIDNDYRILSITSSFEDANNLADELRKKM